MKKEINEFYDKDPLAKDITIVTIIYALLALMVIGIILFTIFK